MKAMALVAVLAPILTQVLKQIDWKPANYPKAIATVLAAIGVIIIDYSKGTLTDSAVVLSEIAVVSTAAVGLYEFAKTAVASARALSKRS